MTEKHKYFLQPGYIFASKTPHLVHTVLGSCISVCIWDCNKQIGGMNHFIHAKPFSNERTAHFGSIAIPCLIKMLVKMGADKSSLKAHIVGGANNMKQNNYKIGERNFLIAKKILKKNSIDVINTDIGGEMGRKVIFDNSTGEIVVYKVNSIRDKDWYEHN